MMRPNPKHISQSDAPSLQHPHYSSYNTEQIPFHLSLSHSWYSSAFNRKMFKSKFKKRIFFNGGCKQIWLHRVL